jgi:outer membrane protein TolC
LTLAFANNREYQSQRETVYTSALALTLAYHEFAPRFLGVITGDWANSGGSESGRIGTDFGLNLLLVSGARLSLHLLNNFSQFFTGDRRQVAATLVNGTLTQPLLRGFGSEIVREPVTQAERDVTYEVRAFERFRKTFAVSVITEYYRVLQERDRVTNEYNNWQSLVSNRDRVEALALAQRVPRFQVDQARQQEFQAQDTWVAAVERYERALDGFKLTLGISTDSNISLDQGELEKLGREAIESLGVTVEVAIEWALKMRLDLKTAWDQVKDTERASRVAADGLRAQLDINANTALTSGSGSAQKPLAFHGQNLTYGFGFDLDLPLDRKRERNAYVQALIANERAKRDLSQAEDNIRLTVRDSYRRLEREIVSYKIQKDSLALAEQRVDSTSALLQAGRAATRDVLESQSALITARNALTGSFINHFIAKIDFLSETEALHVDDQGQIQELPIGVMPND